MAEPTHGQGYAVSSLGAMGDGSRHVAGPGTIARVDAATHRGLRNAGDAEAVVLVAGGKDGYVGRDGQAVGEDPPSGAPRGEGPPSGAPGAAA